MTELEALPRDVAARSGAIGTCRPQDGIPPLTGGGAPIVNFDDPATVRASGN